MSRRVCLRTRFLTVCQSLEIVCISTTSTIDELFTFAGFVVKEEPLEVGLAEA